MLSADDIRKKAALPTKAVRIEALGDEVLLRAMSAADQADFYDRVSEARERGATWDEEGETVAETLRSSVALSALVVSRMVVAQNERGTVEAVFDEPAAMALPEDILTGLAGACFAYVDELAPSGNSEAVPDGSSSSS